jgi:membrane-associated phospholipid phosphatase
LLGALLVAPRARAGVPAAPLDPLAAAPPAAAPPIVQWQPEWRKFRWWEYVGTAGVQALSLYVRWYHPPPEHARWVGYNPVDDTVRGWLVAGSWQNRQEAGRVSDKVNMVGTAIPYAIDLPVVILGHHQIGVAWQMLWMNFQAAAVANLLNNSAFYFVGRGRPSTHDCQLNPSYDPICGGIGNNASFPSGHTVTIATSTGLVCIHHQRMPIFQNAWADRGACVAMILATFTTGITRIMADRHFTSDVLMGATIGFGSGYFLPTLLHYGPRKQSEPEEQRASERSIGLIPFGGPGAAGLGLFGTL